MNNDSCDIIRDLLPGYVDGVLSDAGTRAVRNHLEHCEACQAVYREMKDGFGPAPGQEEQLALDGFKKIRKQTRRLKTAVGIVSGLLLAVVCSVILVLFVIGEPLSTHRINISECVYDERAESLTLKGTIDDSTMSVRRVVFKQSEENPNDINVLVYGAETFPFWKPEQDFSVVIPGVKGQNVYLACPDYDRLEVYSWKHMHFEFLKQLEQEIYQAIPPLDRDRGILSYSGGIDVVEGMEGITYQVDYLTGDNASVWKRDDGIITDGTLEAADFEIWISLEMPYKIRIHDYQTGEWSAPHFQ